MSKIFKTQKWNTNIFNVSSTGPKERETPSPDAEREALMMSFADTTFDKFTTKKFEIDSEDQVKEEVEQLVQKRTKLLWDVAMGAAAEFLNEDDQNVKKDDKKDDENDLEQIEMETKDEKESEMSASVQDRIKKAYEKSKHEFK